jgi:hypothetical protein
LAPRAAAPYTHGGFCHAVPEYNANRPDEGILNMGPEAQRRSELGAFLGNACMRLTSFEPGRSSSYAPTPMRSRWGARRGVLSSVRRRLLRLGQNDLPPHGSLASEGRPLNGYCQSNLLPPEGCECDDMYERSANGTMAG